MNKMNKKSLLGLIITFVALAASVFVLISAGVISLPQRSEKPEETAVVEQDEADLIKAQYRQLYDENKAINEDYVGELFFDSGLINVSFVQARDCYKDNGELYQFYTENGKLVTDAADYTGNDVYIWTYWKTGEYDYNDHGGSTFMDYRNTLSDENLVIYGHHFSVWNDEQRKKAFTPLEKLLDEENLSGNRYATLVLQNEIRHYEIVSVYEFDAFNMAHYDDLQYWRTNYNYDDYNENAYDSEYYDRYIQNVRAVQLYDTGVEWKDSDRTLTLQTCIGGHAGELFEIIVLREISTETY